MAGEFTAGLSGGQRKLLLLELIRQRTRTLQRHNTKWYDSWLIVLDEPFAGVTDDFEPYILQTLQQLQQREQCHVVVVSNDHIPALTSIANSVISVSAVDRSTVRVDSLPNGIPRDQVIHAMVSSTDQTLNEVSKHRQTRRSSLLMAVPTNQELQFFWEVEIRSNKSLVQIGIFGMGVLVLFIVTFWDSQKDLSALVLIAAGLLGFYVINPFLSSLVEWRNAISQEAQALIHSSLAMNKALKAALSFTLVALVSVIQFILINIVVTDDDTNGTFSQRPLASFQIFYGNIDRFCLHYQFADYAVAFHPNGFSIGAISGRVALFVYRGL